MVMAYDQLQHVGAAVLLRCQLFNYIFTILSDIYGVDS